MRLLKSVTILALSLVLISALGGISQAQMAKWGKPTGTATFYGSGESQEYAPDVTVWNGKFWGQSVTDAAKGVLHYGAWDCIGEMAFRGGEISIGDGFCTVTDPDGDKINLRWEVDEPNANPAKFKTKGTYLSGSGKYTGIQGGYNFVCEVIADTSHYICHIVGGEYHLP